MRHIKPSSMGVSLVVILPLLWKGITSQVIHHEGYSIQVSSSVSVQEGLCVSIPCTFTAEYRNTFRNSFGYWMKMPSSSTGYIVATNDKSRDVRKTNFHLKGNPDTGDCTLTITDARKEDEGEYYYIFEESKDSRVRYYYHDIMTNITVPDLTEEPVISDLGTLTAGIEKTMTCAPPGNCSTTSLVFQWKKSDVSGIWKNSSTVTFNPSQDDHQKTITCEMTNSKGNTTDKTIVLDVCYPPRNMEITIHSSKGEQHPASPQVDIDQTETLTLVCRADGNPPVTVVWMRGGDDTETSIMSNNGLSAEINVTSSMVDVYRCSAKNVLGLREERIQVGTKHDDCMDSSIIIGMVIGNIVLLILIIVGSYFCLKRRMEKRLLEKRYPDPGVQETESTYQELKGQKDDVYHDIKVQQ